ncbi:MAG: hypothetical protein ACLTDR_06255 [Adlercreutzia equolifaciens]
MSEATERAENEALVFFDEVSDLSAAERLAGCELLAREEDIDASVLEEAEALPAWEGWCECTTSARAAWARSWKSPSARPSLCSRATAPRGRGAHPAGGRVHRRCRRGRPPHRRVPARRPARSVGRPARRLPSAHPRYPSTGGSHAHRNPLHVSTPMYDSGHGRVHDMKRAQEEGHRGISRPRPARRLRLHDPKSPHHRRRPLRRRCRPRHEVRAQPIFESCRGHFGEKVRGSETCLSHGRVRPRGTCEQLNHGFEFGEDAGIALTERVPQRTKQPSGRFAKQRLSERSGYPDPRPENPPTSSLNRLLSPPGAPLRRRLCR